MLCTGADAGIDPYGGGIIANGRPRGSPVQMAGSLAGNDGAVVFMDAGLGQGAADAGGGVDDAAAADDDAGVEDAVAANDTEFAQLAANIFGAGVKPLEPQAEDYRRALPPMKTQ